MTGSQKTGTALAGVLAVMTLLLASQSLPVMQFLFGQVRTFASLPLFGPVTVAVLVGAIAPAWLPHVLPSSWPVHKVKRITRLSGFTIGFLVVFWRYPNAVGFQYGLFAGSGAYMVWTVVSGFVYRHAPKVEPPSMKPDA